MFFATATPARYHRPAFIPSDRALQRFMEQALAPTRQKACSITQDEQRYTLTFDVPGVTKDQLGIRIEGNTVRIESHQDAPRHYQIAYEFAQDIDALASGAKLDNGVLTLQLAKQALASKATTLTIN